MKSYIYILISIVFCSCSDFLNRDPLNSLSTNNFWKTEADLRLAVNALYQNMNRSHTLDNQTIDCFAGVANQISSGTFTTSNTDGVWNSSYRQIRICNDFLENYSRANISDKLKNRYAGEARFFRAYYYFNLIKRFGDVPYITKTLDMDSPELFSPRESYLKVLDLICSDLEFAIEYLPLKSEIKTDIGRINKGVAQSFYARIALYYGTYIKFHQKDGDYIKYLTVAAAQAKAVIDSKEYSLVKDYRNLFLLPGEDSNEHILSYRFDEKSNSYNPRIRGVIVDFIQDPTKHIADAFLCKDGLPIDKSSYKVNYLPLGAEFENRDPRMSLTIWRPMDSFLGKPFIPNLSNQTKTGYLFKKYGDEGSFNNQKSYIDEILIRYAEVLLIYAEAKYELTENISNDDLNISINTLRRRFEGHSDQLPDLTNEFIMKHKLSMREEIRRERRVELVSESFRYDDLIRWKEAESELPQPILGAMFDQEKYPNVKPGKDINLNEEGFILVQKGNTRTFNSSKDYLFPIPLKEISLNPNLSQNPEW